MLCVKTNVDNNRFTWDKTVDKTRNSCCLAEENKSMSCCLNDYLVIYLLSDFHDPWALETS